MAEENIIYTVPAEKLTAIGDAIREKRNITDGITVEDMPMQIGLIEAGSPSPGNGYHILFDRINPDVNLPVEVQYVAGQPLNLDKESGMLNAVSAGSDDRYSTTAKKVSRIWYRIGPIDLRPYSKISPILFYRKADAQSDYNIWVRCVISETDSVEDVVQYAFDDTDNRVLIVYNSSSSYLFHFLNDGYLPDPLPFDRGYIWWGFDTNNASWTNARTQLHFGTMVGILKN